MNKTFRILALLMVLLLTLTACGSSSDKTSDASSDNAETTAASDVVGDYYLDLTDLGMKLTVYLRLDADGNFTFANSLTFETVKSAGTYHLSDGTYIMVFSQVNGEEKSISDGLTSSFVVSDDGSLDFSVCASVPYGSANISTVSANDPSITLVGYRVTDDYEAPSTDSAFRMGTYTCDPVTQDGVEYKHAVTFYEDNTYLHVIRSEQDGHISLTYEMGSYGVSTTQLAIEPEPDKARVESEVLDESHLSLSVPAYPGAERSSIEFTKIDEPEAIATFTGTGELTGSVVTFDVTFTLYEDGSYVAVADNYEEKGLIAIDTDAGTAKQYPDHPATGVRGLAQLTTVPYATVSFEGGKMVITDLRVCTSENLTRFKATVTEG